MTRVAESFIYVSNVPHRFLNFEKKKNIHFLLLKVHFRDVQVDEFGIKLNILPSLTSESSGVLVCVGFTLFCCSTGYLPEGIVKHKAHGLIGGGLQVCLCTLPNHQDSRRIKRATVSHSLPEC